jgi:hypothetical protein
MKALTSAYSSSLFNIGAVRNIGLLERHDAIELITTPLREDGMQYDDLALEKILDLTAGHPYFTQLICNHLVEYRNQKLLPYVSINDVNVIVDDLLRSGKNYLGYIWSDSTRAERLSLFSVVRILAEKRNAWLPDIVALANRYVQGIEEDKIREALNTWVERDVMTVLSAGTELMYRFNMDLVRLWIYNTITPERIADEI